MRTLTLNIEDAYYKKVVDFLELLPKKAVRVKVSAMSKAQKQAAKDLEDYKRGELKTFEMDDKIWDEMDEIIEKTAKENERRAKR